jgi:hypothetical protein
LQLAVQDDSLYVALAHHLFDTQQEWLYSKTKHFSHTSGSLIIRRGIMLKVAQAFFAVALIGSNPISPFSDRSQLPPLLPFNLL